MFIPHDKASKLNRIRLVVQTTLESERYFMSSREFDFGRFGGGPFVISIFADS